MKHFLFRTAFYALVRLSLAVVVLFASSAGAALADAKPGIAPIQSRPHGKSYSQWAATWWQWALTIPASINPVVDTTGQHCDAGQTGRVWFLAGTFSTDPITRHCTVPTGTALFFPLINVAYFAFLNEPPQQRTEDYIRSQNVCVEDATFPRVEIDGVAVVNPGQYLEKSVLFDVVVPPDNVFKVLFDVDIPQLTLSPSADEGFYLFVFPLTPGQHSLRWRVSSGCFGGISQDITYNLTVR